LSTNCQGTPPLATQPANTTASSSALDSAQAEALFAERYCFFSEAGHPIKQALTLAQQSTAAVKPEPAKSGARSKSSSQQPEGFKTRLCAGGRSSFPRPRSEWAVSPSGSVEPCSCGVSMYSRSGKSKILDLRGNTGGLSDAQPEGLAKARLRPGAGDEHLARFWALRRINAQAALRRTPRRADDWWRCGRERQLARRHRQSHTSAPHV
jgi:hypothetical protein